MLTIIAVFLGVIIFMLVQLVATGLRVEMQLLRLRLSMESVAREVHTLTEYLDHESISRS